MVSTNAASHTVENLTINAVTLGDSAAATPQAAFFALAVATRLLNVLAQGAVIKIPPTLAADICVVAAQLAAQIVHSIEAEEPIL